MFFRHGVSTQKTKIDISTAVRISSFTKLVVVNIEATFQRLAVSLSSGRKKSAYSVGTVRNMLLPHGLTLNGAQRNH
jgi:hypothetical protein